MKTKRSRRTLELPALRVGRSAATDAVSWRSGFGWGAVGVDGR